MKKIAIVSLLMLASASVFAADGCTGTAGNGTAVTAATDGTKFVRVAFTPKCSANTLVQYTDAGTALHVGAGSTKGKTSFKGSTNGGAVSKSGDCAATGCTADAVATALAAAAS